MHGTGSAGTGAQPDELRANPGPRAATCATLALMGTLNRGAMTALNFYIRDRRA